MHQAAKPGRTYRKRIQLLFHYISVVLKVSEIGQKRKILHFRPLGMMEFNYIFGQRVEGICTFL